MEDDLRDYNFSFKDKLQDIVAKIKMASDLTITYEDFEPLTIKSHFQEYLKQISPAERNRYLTAKLQNYLYNILVDSSLEFNDALSSLDGSSSGSISNRQEMANYDDRWSRSKFYQQLTQHNHGQGYQDPDWLVIKQVSDSWQVTKNDLTLLVKAARDLAQPEEHLFPGKLVSLKMPPNLVEHGLYIAVGDAGSTKATDSDSEYTVTQLYFNVCSEGALSLLDNFTQQLNAVKIPFNFQVAYAETDFDRLDAAENQAFFQSEIPFFCQFLAPGLGLAEKPRAPNFERENIGQHYCGLIAQAIVAIWQQHLMDTDKFEYVLEYLSKAGVDIERIYLNPHGSVAKSLKRIR